MASGKYLTIDASGHKIEEQGINSSAGAADADKIPRLDADGLLDQSMMPAGVAPDTADLTASEALAAGDFVNVWDDGGTPSCRKADASTASAGKRADGYVKAAVTLGGTATVFFEGSNDQLTGLTVGSMYYLDGTTPGAVTATAPTTSGHILQEVGRAVSATKIATEISAPVIRA